MDPLLNLRLQNVARRRAAVRVRRIASWSFLALVGLGVVLYPSAAATGARGALGTALALGGLVALALTHRHVRRTSRDARATAQHVEAAYPDLDASLVTACELEPDLPDGRYGFLARRLLDDVLHHARRTTWERATPPEQVRRARGSATFATLAWLGAIAWLLWPAAAGEEAFLPRVFGPQAAPPAQAARVAVDPGDVELERGRSLLITARFEGATPADVDLVVLSDDGTVQRHPMRRSLDDPLFGTRLADVRLGARYHVVWDGDSSSEHRIEVFELPRLVRSDVHVSPPAYSGLEARDVADTRRVTALVGSELTVSCTWNVPVASARVIDPVSGAAHALTPLDVEGLRHALSWTLERSVRLVLELETAAGRRNALPTEFVFEALANAPPEVRLLARRDPRVSPLEELALEARAHDDLGLVRWGVQYGLAGREPVDVVLGERVAARAAQTATHLIPLETLGARPDQLLTYHVWAEDHAPDGSVRRTTSDLQLAEVRPFEEIFRQGEEPPGGAGEAPGDAAGEAGGAPRGGADGARNAELQKEILQATWKLRARAPDDSFREDAGVVRDAQRELLENLDQIANAPRSAGIPDLVEILEATRSAMERALDGLGRAAEDGALEPLDDAVLAEQEAYQELLRLRQREFQVARAQQPRSARSQSSASRQGQPSQRQLDQLELRNDPNRYETQRQARAESAAATEEQRESLEVLDRLRQLAQRQEDLNRELQELRSELERARDAEERADAERRLKRLQEEQRELLQDTDELRQRLEAPRSRERLAETREALDEARESVRRSSEALEREDVAQAAAEGSRAEREFQDVERELRDRTGAQFEERMRTMRREARELEERQERLVRDLEREAADDRRTLRATPERERLEGDLREQEQRVSELLREMQDTVRAAETLEPLLAEDLFDTVRRSLERGTEDAVQLTREMVERGFEADAGDSARVAREGLEELRTGVERASERVLGSGEEALARAERELERLGEELRDEIRDARGEQRSSERGAANDAGERPPQERSGERSDESGRPAGGESPERAERGRGEPDPSRPGEAAGERPPRGATGERRPGGEPRDGDGPPERERASPQRGGERGGTDRPARPLTGEDFLDWADRLRDVEDMLDDPELRAEATRIRQRARAIRAEFKRHATEPQWDLVQENVATPLAELERRVSEELARRRSTDALVPVDRDPVPPRFRRDVDRYYEELGRPGKKDE